MPHRRALAWWAKEPHDVLEVLPRRLLTRIFAVQYVVAGLLALAWVVLPHGSSRGDEVVAAAGAVALVFGAALWPLATPAVPSVLLHGAIAASQVLIAVAVAATGNPENLLVVFFLWATPYGGLLGHRAAVLHVAWTTAAMATALLSMPSGVAARGSGTFVVMTGTVVLMTLLVDRVTRRLRHDATHDPLTGLANRAAFTRRTRAALTRRGSRGGTVVVLLIDLDRFKNINDTLGHHTGDAVLREIAPRLVRSLRPEDTVARLGGDEFAILCEDPTGDLDVAQVAARVARIWAEPVRLEQGTMYLTGSIGAASATTGTDSCASLLRDADAAMYRAKASGPGAWALHEPGTEVLSAESLHLERGLREAVDRGELFLAYQPVVDLSSGRCTGVEALLRWDSAAFGSVPPATFIPLAEETGLIAPLGAWVLDRAARDLARWRAAGDAGDSFRVAVNVSPRQLTPDLPTLVVSALARHGLPATALALEITESALLAPGSVGPVLEELRALGVRLILDDFGTGYASLSHLQRFRFDELKIDRSFVADICDKPCTHALVRAILSMAEALGLGVVAEGIETSEQRVALQSGGCPTGQGFLFARPVPAEELPAALDRLWSSRGAVPGIVDHGRTPLGHPVG